MSIRKPTVNESAGRRIGIFNEADALQAGTNADWDTEAKDKSRSLTTLLTKCVETGFGMTATSVLRRRRSRVVYSIRRGGWCADYESGVHTPKSEYGTPQPAKAKTADWSPALSVRRQ
jgi:hypothetical protein